MQRLPQGALAELAPHGAEIWLDGGHNPGAGVVVAEALAEQEEKNPRPLFLICGMINTKDQTGYFRAFKGMARHVYHGAGQPQRGRRAERGAGDPRRRCRPVGGAGRARSPMR